MKGKWLWTIGNFLIWVVPLIYILAVAISVTNVETIVREGGQQIVFGTWSMVILGGLLIAYISRFRKAMKEKLLVSQIRDGVIPPLWRLIQLIEFGLSTGALLGIIFVIQRLANPLYTFLLVSLTSGSVGYLLLIFDSANKVNKVLYEKNHIPLSQQNDIANVVRQAMKEVANEKTK